MENTTNLKDITKNNNENIRILIITKLFIIILSYNNNNLIEIESSMITISKKLLEIKKIFSFDTYFFKRVNYPNEFYMNGNLKNKVNLNYYLDQQENLTSFIWNNKAVDSQNLFYNCSNIIEIYIFNFDISNCQSMIEVLTSYSIIISLNNSNFGISQMSLIEDMFKNCLSFISLFTLYFSNFNFSNVKNIKRNKYNFFY